MANYCDTFNLRARPVAGPDIGHTILNHNSRARSSLSGSSRCRRVSEYPACWFSAQPSDRSVPGNSELAYLLGGYRARRLYARKAGCRITAGLARLTPFISPQRAKIHPGAHRIRSKSRKRASGYGRDDLRTDPNPAPVLDVVAPTDGLKSKRQCGSARRRTASLPCPKLGASEARQDRCGGLGFLRLRTAVRNLSATRLVPGQCLPPEPRGRSSMVEPLPSKQNMRVRFPTAAPIPCMPASAESGSSVAWAEGVRLADPTVCLISQRTTRA